MVCIQLKLDARYVCVTELEAPTTAPAGVERFDADGLLLRTRCK